MKFLIQILLLGLSLFFHGNAFLHSPGWYSREVKESNHVAPGALTLCPSLPEASMTADELASELQSSLKQADSQVKAALLEDKSPGGAVLSFVYGDKVVWSGGYGLKNMSDRSLGAPDENTRFRIGSISKTFTALQTLIMRDHGSIKSLDDDIKPYFPDFSVINPFQTKRGITFRQLMSHMSGLGRNPPCEGLFDYGCNISDTQMMKNIAGMKLMFPPGSQPAYSNLGFGLLGKVLTRIAHLHTWDSLLSKLVTGPLKMESTGNSFEHMDWNEMAVGYYPDGSTADLIDIGWDIAAGQCYSTTADLAKLMSLIFSDQKSSEVQLVDGETLREWVEPVYTYLDGTGYSLPWELVPMGNYTLRTKAGVLNGYNAEFQMAVESKIGFIFLQSCDGCKSHQKIIEIAQNVLSDMSSTERGSQVPPSLPPQPEDYVGVYTASLKRMTVVANITLANLGGHQAMFTTEGGETALLEWREKDSFQISLRGLPVPCSILSSGHIGAWVYFSRDDASGKVASLSVPAIAYKQVYKKQ